jgi:SNF2 family DNA or RNA helicase
VYLVNFGQSNFIQPVLQTAQKSGWSGGRNIAMKSFAAGTTPDMTEQDYRIAKTIRRYNSGYYGGEEYEFTENTIKELVGHPYLFLATGHNISVELIEEKPVIEVKKTAKGYTLSSNIKNSSESIIIEKETNTRFKLYNLTANQKEILDIISIQNIVVPESGKDKLMKLLAGFSTQMEVHSDLLSSAKDNNSTIKDIAPDSRIRVQLLPLGSGLKAELYSKPFGATPPYCKPGKGGLVLLANEKGNQLQVKRNLKLETQYFDALMEDIQAIESLTISDGLLSFENEMDSLDLLDKLQIHQDKCVIEWPEGVRLKLKGSVNINNLSLKVKANNNWFDLQGELKIDEKTVLSIQELMALSEKGHNQFIELSNGEFMALSKELKKHLDELQAFSTNGKNGLQINKFASVAMGDFFDSVKNLKADKNWKDFRANINHEDNRSVAIPMTLQADLRPYQEEGFRWMNQLAQWGAGACLADDMGLGKTIQSLTLLLHRAHLGPALVIAPVSVIGNWLKEATRFAPSLTLKTLDANNRTQIIEGLEAGDVLISSYGLLQSEEKLFVKQTYATLILDEAHTIKNYATKTSKSTMLLNASFRVALTGTPLQNHLGEIWNLFNFINPGLLGNLEQFRDRFIKSTDENSSKQLKKLITPFILRRTKSVVLDELPSKTEIIKKIELSTKERAFYEALRRKALENIASDDTQQGNKQFKVMAEITKLRQASCNPLLVDANTDISSSKLEAFLGITEELIENKHKALVFSQFVTHLAIMRKALDAKGIKYQYLDGSTPIAKREEAVKKFQSGEGDLFLISLKAGGLGLNLTAADYVIHLDPWWNPAIEDQASDRAHRMGQLRPVTIYRLVAENTIEEKIIQLHNTKRNLAESLLEGSDQSAQMSINELINLIKGD